MGEWISRIESLLYRPTAKDVPVYPHPVYGGGGREALGGGTLYVSEGQLPKPIDCVANFLCASGTPPVWHSLPPPSLRDTSPVNGARIHHLATQTLPEYIYE